MRPLSPVRFEHLGPWFQQPFPIIRQKRVSSRGQMACGSMPASRQFLFIPLRRCRCLVA